MANQGLARVLSVKFPSLPMKEKKQENVEKVKKPMNAFFVYRKALRERIIQKYGTTKSHEISKIAGECWAMEPLHVKNYFRDISFKLHEDARVEKMKKQRRPSNASECSDLTACSQDSYSRRMSRTLEGIEGLNLENQDRQSFEYQARPVSFDSYDIPPVNHQRSYSMSSVSSTNSIYNQFPDFPLYQPHLYPISSDVMEALETNSIHSGDAPLLNNVTGNADKSTQKLPSLTVDFEIFKIDTNKPVALEDFL